MPEQEPDVYLHEGTFNVRPHFYLYQAGRQAYQIAIENKNPHRYPYPWMTCIVFSAFSLEAYLNFAGGEILSYWDKLEKITFKSKLEILHEVASLQYEPGNRPINTVLKLISMRNKMAHGKPAKFSFSIQSESKMVSPMLDTIGTDWGKFCTKENAKRGLDDVAELVETLHSALKLEQSAMYYPGWSEVNVTKKEKPPPSRQGKNDRSKQ